MILKKNKTGEEKVTTISNEKKVTKLGLTGEKVL